MTVSIMHKKQSQTGFTLVEMAIILLVMGLFIGSVFSFVSIREEQNNTTLTLSRQKIIAGALSRYASTHGFLPCPAAPDAATPGQERASCVTDANRDGVVPYYTLGLGREDATDGYGNPFTYAVSEMAHAPDPDVDESCRIQNVWGLPPNYNPLKAMFCCQAVPDSRALRIVSTAGGGVSVIPTQNAYGVALAPVDTMVPSDTTPDILTYVAYVLISHGQNGYRSYVWDKPSRKTPGGSNDEYENADNNRAYVYKAPDLTTTNYFDDIVFYQTQEQVISYFGDTSCMLP